MLTPLPCSLLSSVDVRLVQSALFHLFYFSSAQLSSAWEYILSETLSDYPIYFIAASSTGLHVLTKISQGGVYLFKQWKNCEGKNIKLGATWISFVFIFTSCKATKLSSQLWNVFSRSRSQSVCSSCHMKTWGPDSVIFKFNNVKSVHMWKFFTL